MRTLITLAIVAAALPVFAQDYNSATASVGASARIVAPVTMFGFAQLNFGGIVVSPNLGGATKATFELKPKTGDFGAFGPELEKGDYVNCSEYKGSKGVGSLSLATFHYTHDVWAAQHTVGALPAGMTFMDGGIGYTLSMSGNDGTNLMKGKLVADGALGTGECDLELQHDLPADLCSGVGIGSPTDPWVRTKHFGVGGKLSIPAGTYGAMKGTITCTVQYI